MQRGPLSRPSSSRILDLTVILNVGQPKELVKPSLPDNPSLSTPARTVPPSTISHCPGERTWTALRVRRPYSALAGNHAVRRETQYNYWSKGKAQIGEEAE